MSPWDPWISAIDVATRQRFSRCFMAMARLGQLHSKRAMSTRRPLAVKKVRDTKGKTRRDRFQHKVVYRDPYIGPSRSLYSWVVQSPIYNKQPGAPTGHCSMTNSPQVQLSIPHNCRCRNARRRHPRDRMWTFHW